MERNEQMCYRDQYIYLLEDYLKFCKKVFSLLEDKLGEKKKHDVEKIKETMWLWKWLMDRDVFKKK